MKYTLIHAEDSSLANTTRTIDAESLSQAACQFLGQMGFEIYREEDEEELDFSDEAGDLSCLDDVDYDSDIRPLSTILASLGEETNLDYNHARLVSFP